MPNVTQRVKYSGITTLFGSSLPFLGAQAGDAITTAGYSVAIGHLALTSEDTAQYNTAIGYKALYTQNGGVANTVIGFQAGQFVTTGDDNTIIGGEAGDALTTGSNNIIIGHDAAASAVDVSNEITLGDANISAFRCADQSIAALSDGRDKSEVEESPYGLEFINKLKPVKFTWDFRPEHMSDVKQGKSRVGFIAQDLQEAMPNNDNDILDLVYEISEDRLEAKYGNLIPVMAKAIQELSAEVKELKKQING